MDKLALALQILQGANLLTPAIATVFSAVREGRDTGKSDQQISDETMEILLRVKSKAQEQKSDKP